MFLSYHKIHRCRKNWFSTVWVFLSVATIITVATTHQVVADDQVATSAFTDRDSVRRTNRNNALKTITIPSDSLVLWGVIASSPYSGTRDNRNRYTASLYEYTAQRIANRRVAPKVTLFKDEFETTPAFELRQKEYDKQYDAQVKERELQIEQERPAIYSEALNAILGRPLLNRVVYDADKESLSLLIVATQADYAINAKIKVPVANAKETKANILRQ